MGWNIQKSQSSLTLAGSPDTSFGTNGIIKDEPVAGTTAFSDIQLFASAVQADGKIILVGYSNANVSYDFFVSRRTADGQLDSTFGNNGIVITDFGGSEGARALGIQSDGKIVVAGSLIFNSDPSKFLVSRYNSDGTLDSSFGTAGKVVTQLGGTATTVGGIEVQSSGLVTVVGGKSFPQASGGDFTIARYNSSGLLDSNFGNNGVVTTPILDGNDFPTGVFTDSNGKFVVTGTARNLLGTGSAALVRYKADGSLDTDSLDPPKTIIACGCSISSAVPQTDGKILIAGTVNSNSSTFLLMRFDRANGKIDLSFGSNGQVVTTVGSLSGFSISGINSVALQIDGKIIAAGYSNNNTGSDFSSVRYNSDGSLDPTYGVNGILITAITRYEESATSILIQTDGKIVLSGNTSSNSNNPNNYFLLRYKPNGSVDSSFGKDGSAVFSFDTISNFGFSTDSPADVAVQQDDKILIAGTAKSGFYKAAAVLRYNSDGSFDETFGISGKVLTLVDSQDLSLKAITVQPDGKILVVGYLSNGFSALIRYDSSGILDTSFGGSGIVINTDIRQLVDVICQPDNKIVAIGYTNLSFAVARFNADGSIDTSFDGDGEVFTSVGSNAEPKSVALQSNGKIVVAGQVFLNNRTSSLLTRYNPNGSLDITFDGDGVLITALGYSCSATDVIIQPDGKIITAGNLANGTYTSEFGYVLARYNSNGALDLTFGEDGLSKTRTYFRSTDFSPEQEKLNLQNDGKIICSAYNSNNSSFLLRRYNTDGRLDVRFGDKGTALKPNVSRLSLFSIAKQSDGKTIGAGIGTRSNDLTGVDFTVVRYLNLPDPALTTVIADGDITDPAVWNNGLPNSNTVAVIPTGRSVYINTPLTIDRLEVQSGSSLTLNADLTINNSLDLRSKIYANSNRVIVRCDASILGADQNSYIIGTVQKEFCNTDVFSFPIGTQNGFSPIIAVVTRLTQFGSSLSVNAVESRHPSAPATEAFARRYWKLTEVGDLSAFLEFNYQQNDLPNVAESSFIVRRFNGLTFDSVPTTVNSDTNLARTTNSISAFSDWTLSSPLVPTAANADISGRVIDKSGRGIARARLILQNTQTGESFAATTNPFGYFRFTNQQSGNLYVISAAAKGRIFQPASRTFELLENVSDLVFVGSQF